LSAPKERILRGARCQRSFLSDQSAAERDHLQRTVKHDPRKACF